MDIRHLDSAPKTELRRPLPKPSIIHVKGEKRFFVDTNYLPFLYLIVFLYFFIVLLICLRWISPLVFLFFVPVWLVVLLVFLVGYRYEFNEDGIICRLLKLRNNSGPDDNIKNRGGRLLKHFDAESVSQAEVIYCRHTVYIRVAFRGCRPFSEPWLWLHLLRNMGKVLILRIRKAEADRANALLRSYFYGDGLSICDEDIEKKQSKPEQKPKEKTGTSNAKWRCVLLIYWLITLALIPLFGIIFNKGEGTGGTILLIACLAIVAVSSFVPSRRQRMAYAFSRLASRSTYRELSTKRKWFFGLLCLLLTVLYAVFFYCFYQLWKSGGVPSIDHGIYCIWNHGFVRRITPEEYHFLSFLDNLEDACEPALFSTVFLILECVSED